MPVIEVKSRDFFRTALMSTSDLMIVDFYAPWCGPCRVLGSYLDEFARSDARIKILKVNVDEQPELASDFSVSRLPTLAFYKNGHMVEMIVGFDKPRIAATIMNYA